MQILLISVFGIMGVLSRFLITQICQKVILTFFPVSTLAINLIGSFLIGVVYVLGTEKQLISEDLRIALMVGFLGGFTTFSAFSLESYRLLEDQKFTAAFAYFFLSPLLGIFCTFIAILGVRRLL